jgi:hypothetical protein
MKCLSCCAEAITAETKNAIGGNETVPEPEDAITMAPAWQQQRVGPQLVMACVTVPVCKRHVAVEELSPAEQAVRSGKLLEGRVDA